MQFKETEPDHLAFESSSVSAIASPWPVKLDASRAGDPGSLMEAVDGFST